MTAGLRPYPEYKDSGLPWLGKIPRHWRLLKIKRIARINPSRAEVSHLRKIEELVVFLPMERVSTHGKVDGSERRPIIDIWQGSTYFRRGDVLVAKITPCFENGKGACLKGLPTEIGFGSTEFIVLRPGYDVTPEFLYQLTKLTQFRLLGVEFMTGAAGQQRVSPDFVANFIVSIPPIGEQERITYFLASLEGKIRRFISNRRQLIEVLNDQKQAIISRFVARGIDPNVPLKSSGIEWLGNIPGHWRLVRLKHVSRVQTGITLGKKYLGQHIEERPYLRVANVQTGRLDLRIVKTVAIPPSEIAGSELKPGDVLMTEGGDIDKLGRGCVWRGEIEGCLHQNHIFAVRVDQHSLLPEYLVALMASHHGRVYFQLTAKKTTNLASTNSSTLGAFPLILPRVSEQRRILDAIARETLALDAAINNAQREIDLIREYRSRLIADVVTGKVDVRHHLSDTLAEPISVAVRKPFESGRKANIYFRRAVFAAEIVHRLHKEPTFGHIKFQKLIHLCQKRCGVDIGITYYRQAAGPYDPKALRSIDSQMKNNQWYAAQKTERGYRYIPLAKAGSHKVYFDRHFADIEEEFTRVIEILRKATWEQCEIVATLFEAWDDLLSSGEQVTEDRIIYEVLHWNESKKRINEGRWRSAIDWMKKKDLVPSFNATAKAQDLEFEAIDEYLDEIPEGQGDEVVEEVTDADD